MIEKVIAAFIAFSSPNIDTPRFSAEPQLTNMFPLSTITSCPSHENARSFLPRYSLENRVAEFESYSDLEIPFGDYKLNISTEFFLVAYNSNSKNANNLNLTDKSEIIQFVNEGNFDIIEIYDGDIYGMIHDKPSAIIYRLDEATYIFFDLEGHNDLANGKFNYSECFSNWESDLIQRTTEDILMKRVLD